MSHEPIPDQPFHLVMPDPDTGGASIAMIGATRSGKTTLLIHVLKKYFKDHIGVLMSQSTNASIYDDVPKTIPKVPMFSPEMVNEMYKINLGTKNKYEFLAIIDDCPTIKFSKELLKLLTIYRNSHLSAIICMQSLKLFNTAARGNINFVMLGRCNSFEAAEQAVRGYLMHRLPGRNVAEKVAEYMRITEDHHWIVVDNINGNIFRTRLEV